LHPGGDSNPRNTKKLRQSVYLRHGHAGVEELDVIHDDGVELQETVSFKTKPDPFKEVNVSEKMAKNRHFTGNVSSKKLQISSNNLINRSI
jgi:hypothetical protein